MVRKFIIGDKVRCFSGFEPHGKLRFDPDSPIHTVTDIKVVRATKSLKYQLDGDKYWSGNFLEKVEDGA